MALWRWTELCTALELPEVAGPEVQGIQIDSRRVVSGDLFVALTGDPGPRFQTSSRSTRDGHDFVNAAFAAGAAGALVHRDGDYAGPVLRVADTLDGLWALGRAARSQLQGRVVAVTGSSGKTTVKQLLSHALSAYAAHGSLNNHIGVPWSLALTPRNAAFAVYEIGTNHPGEIAPLARLARPQVTVVLNVQSAHIGNFSGYEGLLREKLSISEGLEAGGTLVVEDRVDTGDLPSALPRICFGLTPAADVQLLETAGNTARYRTPLGELHCRVPGGGAHRALSLAAVLGVLLALDVPLERASALPESLVPAGRGNVLRAAGRRLIDDSYNANPDSMRAALKTLASEPGRRIAVLGEMLELGEVSEASHRALAADCDNLDAVICVGAGARILYDALPQRLQLGYFEHAQGDTGAEIIRIIDEISDSNSTILVKGSNRVFWACGFVERLLSVLAAHQE